MIETLPKFSLSTEDRINGMLSAARAELDIPLYFDLAKTSKFLIENFDFRRHLSTFGAENTPKSGALKT